MTQPSAQWNTWNWNREQMHPNPCGACCRLDFSHPNSAWRGVCDNTRWVHLVYRRQRSHHRYGVCPHQHETCFQRLHAECVCVIWHMSFPWAPVPLHRGNKSMCSFSFNMACLLPCRLLRDWKRHSGRENIMQFSSRLRTRGIAFHPSIIERQIHPPPEMHLKLHKQRKTSEGIHEKGFVFKRYKCFHTLILFNALTKTNLLLSLIFSVNKT